MNLIKRIKNNPGYFALILIIFAIGFYFRIIGLGKWPLALDEYYIVKSAENILQYGIPEWTSGGYYTRGILYQYFIAGLLVLGVKTEFASRIIPLLLNLLAWPTFFILTKKIGGKLFATLILVVYVFSTWETEFSRFARMYVPFQTIFIWYILFLYKYLIEGDKKSVKWIFTLSFLSIFVYEASIFVALLNFLIIFWNEETKRVDINKLFKLKFNFLYAVIVLFIFACTYFFNTFDARSLNSPDLYPKDYMISHGYMFKSNRFHIPQILLMTLDQNILIPCIFVAGISIYGFYKIVKVTNSDWFFKTLIAGILILSLLNLFGLILLLILIFFLLGWITIRDLKKKEIQIVIGTVLISLIFWVTYSFLTTSWYSFFPGFEPESKTAIIKKIFILFFNYPNNYFELYRYAVTIPVLSLLLIISTIFITVRLTKISYYDSLPIRIILFIFLVITVIVSLIDTPLSETRYTFFLYPIVMLIIFFAIHIVCNQLFKKGIKEKIAFLLIGFCFFYFSGDFSLKHLTQIDSKEINFRTVYNHNLVRHYYPRWDVQTPAELVNKEKQKNDITIIDELNIEYYLDTLDYIYINQDHERFKILSVDGGKKERWTNANLVYTNQQLLDLIKITKGNIWFISIHKPHLNEINFKENSNQYLLYTSIDKMIFVYKIPGGTTISEIQL